MKILHLSLPPDLWEAVMRYREKLKRESFLVTTKNDVGVSLLMKGLAAVYGWNSEDMAKHIDECGADIREEDE